MQVSFTIQDELVAKVRGKAVTRKMTGLKPEILQHIFLYGFQRINNDAGAVGKDEDTGVALAKADKKWDALVAGNLRVKTSRETDPVRREALLLVIERIKQSLKAKGLDADKADGRELRQKAIAVLDGPNGGPFLEKAKSIVAARAEAGLDKIEIDLEGFGEAEAEGEPED